MPSDCDLGMLGLDAGEHDWPFATLTVTYKWTRGLGQIIAAQHEI